MSFGLASGLGAFNAVSNILAGPPVSIGGVGLTGHEVPASMPFGGEQRLVEHDLVGGGNFVDVLGPKEAPREWSGTFIGMSAVSRARQLDALRIAGKAVPLSWGDFRCTVVIRSFKASYSRKGSLVPYAISCVVVSKPGEATSKPGLLASVAGDISKALDLPTLLPAAQTAIKVASAAMPVVSVVTGFSPAYRALSGAVGAASGAVGVAQGLADTQLANVAAGAAPSGSIFGGSAGLALASAAQDASAAASQAEGFVGRAFKSLGG